MPDDTFDILLVEDSPDDAEFFKHALRETGLPARLQIAPDGAEALALLFGANSSPETAPLIRPKVIFLDLKLPKVDGLEVLRLLKNNIHTRAIPVVVLTSSQEKRDLADSYAFGVNSYLVKPMDLDEFGEAVRMACRYWLQFNELPG